MAIDLNSRILNKLPGFSSHMVVIFGKHGQKYGLHDPGLPPQKSRIVDSKLLLKAWQYAGKDNTALVAVGR